MILTKYSYSEFHPFIFKGNVTTSYFFAFHFTHLDELIWDKLNWKKKIEWIFSYSVFIVLKCTSCRCKRVFNFKKLFPPMCVHSKLQRTITMINNKINIIFFHLIFKGCSNYFHSSKFPIWMLTFVHCSSSKGFLVVF